MIASRGSRLGLIAGSLLAGLGAMTVPAAGQTLDYGRVQMDNLAVIDPESVGVNDQPPASLGIDLWQGAERTQIVGLIRDLPRRIESPSLHALTRRLLLTSARAPVSGISAIQTMTAGRVTTLASIGATSEALALLNAAGARSRGEAMARIEIDMLFLGGETAKACEAANAGSGRYTSADWQYSVAFCRALANDPGGARLAVDLIRDSGAAEYQPLNGILVEAVLGNKPPGALKFTSAPTPLQLAMLTAAKLPIPREALTADRPDMQRALARIESAPPALRLEAAEMAVANNAIEGAAMADLYAKSDLPPGTGWTPAARAAAWRKVAAQADPVAKVRALKDLLESARKRGGWRAVAAASVPFFDTLRPGEANLVLAEEAVRALLVAGRALEARNWYALIAAQSAKPEQNAQRVRLWPLIRLADPEGTLAFSDIALDSWWRATKTADAKGAPAKAALLYSLLAANADPVPASLWAELPKTALGSEKTAAATIRLDDRSLSRGETVLQAIIVLGEAERGQVDPTAIKAAVAGLNRTDLAAEARAAALEIALDAGI